MMTDLIRRADAIEAVASADETNGTVKVFSGLEIIDMLKALPSAEQVTGKLKNPCDSLLTGDSDECKEQKSKLDLIRRADAIEAVVCHIWHMPNEAYRQFNCENIVREVVEDAIKRLPSAEAVKYESTVTLNSPISISAEAVQGWIPCSERLPDVGRAVLASGYYNDVYIATLKEDKREEYYWSAFGGFPVMFSAVDAWMPLPKPYKGGDDE